MTFDRTMVSYLTRKTNKHNKQVQIKCVVEIAGEAHRESLHKALERKVLLISIY